MAEVRSVAFGIARAFARLDPNAIVASAGAV
jgi:hypothetical protein